MLVRRSSSAWRACSGLPRTRSISDVSGAFGTGRQVHAAEGDQVAHRRPAPGSRTTPTTVSAARWRRRCAPGDADCGASRRTTCPTASPIRPELARDGLGHDDDARLRGAFRLREAAPAHDIDAEHIEVFGRHGHAGSTGDLSASRRQRTCRRTPTRRSATTRRTPPPRMGRQQPGAARRAVVRWRSRPSPCRSSARPDPRRGGKGASQKNGGADQEESRCADLDGDQGMPCAARARIPRHFAAHRPHQLEARGLQRRREPEEHRRDNGAGHQEHHAPASPRRGRQG